MFPIVPAKGGSCGAVREGGWGMVAVVSGRHAGVVGYYHDEGERNGWAVVYAGTPLVTEPICARLTEMRPATWDEIRRWRSGREADLRRLRREIAEMGIMLVTGRG